jgi:hypothetical protein
MSQDPPKPWMPILFEHQHDRYNALTEARQNALFQAIRVERIPLHLACKRAEVSLKTVEDIRDRVERNRGSIAEERFILALDAALSEVEIGHIQTLETIFRQGEQGAVKAGEMLLKTLSPEQWGGNSPKVNRLQEKLREMELSLAKTKARVARRLDKDDLDKRAKKARAMAVFPHQVLDQMKPEIRDAVKAEFDRLGYMHASQAEEAELAAERAEEQDKAEAEHLAKLARDMGFDPDSMS